MYQTFSKQFETVYVTYNRNIKQTINKEGTDPICSEYLFYHINTLTYLSLVQSILTNMITTLFIKKNFKISYVKCTHLDGSPRRCYVELNTKLRMYMMRDCWLLYFVVFRQRLILCWRCAEDCSDAEKKSDRDSADLHQFAVMLISYKMNETNKCKLTIFRASSFQWHHWFVPKVSYEWWMLQDSASCPCRL